jgi:hypothetical protein
MTRLIFLLAALRGPGAFGRLAFFYVLGMLFLLLCILGGLPHIPASPAHAVSSPYAAMPKPVPIPSNAAQEMSKRLENRTYFQK